MTALATDTPIQKPFYKHLYPWVMLAIALGVVAGIYEPKWAANDWVKLIADLFIRLIKMMIAPLIFCSVAAGLAKAKSAGRVGAIGFKAIVYFEIVSSLALVIGLIVGEVLQPGAGLHLSPPADQSALAKFTGPEHALTPQDFISHMIPETFLGAFVDGNLLQVLLLAILFGLSLMALGERGEKLAHVLDVGLEALFGMIGRILWLAPIGAGAAMAYSIAKYGPALLGKLAALIGTFYLTSAAFIVVVLGFIALLAGMSIFRFLWYIKDEILLVLGTSSSESALPSLMTKLRRLGCSDEVVGLVVPLGYSFNLDGTNIYMTLASLFVAQIMGVHLSLTQELTLLLVAMLTSKGASGVTGAGFITLATTLATVNPVLVPGMALLLGIDKFMSECRALTNVIGNGVACVVLSKWEGSLDKDQMQSAFKSVKT